MTIRLYGIPNCDTVKKARAFLNEAGVPHDFHDFKKLGVPEDHLQCWIQQVGWERLLNRQGMTWRKLEAAAQAAVVDAGSARALMLSQPSVIKRPVVETPSGDVLVGFDPDRYARLR
jgi:arsenate reductase